jgi:cyclic dehypoxanthinyl futalosine synthase
MNEPSITNRYRRRPDAPAQSEIAQKTELAPIRDIILNHQRINADEAMLLLDTADVLDLAFLADAVRERLHPDPVVTFVVDRNINYTNGCICGCKFCAYYRPPEHPEAFVITNEALGQKIQETIDLGGTQILLQGGLNPHLGLDYYLDLLHFIKSHFHIHIHGFSPPEIAFIAGNAGLSLKETLCALITAGLDSIPGGGAEILSDDIRQRISPNKCATDTWLSVMEQAHGLGLKSTATMMFGHVETTAHIIRHLIKIRDLQDRTRGFTAFIPWTFQRGNTNLPVAAATPVHYLRVLAVSRLVLDNVPNIQASWVTQGEKIAQMALAFGANDLGSTMIEENVVAAAGVDFKLSLSDMVRMITGAGYSAIQRDCYYNSLTEHRMTESDARRQISG